MEIETKRLLLRPLQLTDIDDLLEYTSDAETVKYLFEPKTREEELEFIKQSMDTNDDSIRLAIVLKEKNKMIGTIGLTIRDNGGPKKRGTFGWSINKNYWNNGYTTEAAKTVLDLAKKDLYRVDAKADVDNIGSWKVMEHIGMHREGKLEKYNWTPLLKEYRDMYQYALAMEDKR